MTSIGRAWIEPSDEPERAQPGTLYIVPVPIGNPRDMTLRAADILATVDVIAAEDTRDVAHVLRAYGIATPTVSYHDFNERSRSARLVAQLRAGESIAIVADAGTPLIHDPGYRLVTAAIAAGVTVTSLPGASAVTTALVASGLPVAAFLFAGFPPRAPSARRRAYAALRAEPATLVFFEAPHRLIESLADLLSVIGNRQACLAGNITKSSERYLRGTLSELHGEMAASRAIRGEWTVVVGGAVPGDHRDEKRAAAGEAAQQAVTQHADSRELLMRLQVEFGLSRRDAYATLIAAQRAHGRG